MSRTKPSTDSWRWNTCIVLEVSMRWRMSSTDPRGRMTGAFVLYVSGAGMPMKTRIGTKPLRVSLQQHSERRQRCCWTPDAAVSGPCGAAVESARGGHSARQLESSSVARVFGLGADGGSAGGRAQACIA
eukprot:3843655-Amphidinium_carterae.1